MFEILIGRTPFEEDDQEQFTNAEDYLLYYERAGQGKWLGEWSMPSGEHSFLPVTRSSNMALMLSTR
jgi:protein-serine/threonine kinase